MTNEGTSPKNADSKSSPHAGVTEKRVRGADGRLKTMRIVDLGSPTLSDDLMYLFQKNVDRARRDNRRLIGAADGFTAKK